jgi:hypothetical protein
MADSLSLEKIEDGTLKGKTAVPHKSTATSTCADQYFACQVTCWRISEGWFDFLVTISQACALYFSGSVIAGSNGITNSTLLIIFQSIAFFAQVMKAYALKAISEDSNNS